MPLSLASMILRRRRSASWCPIARLLASRAARTLGRKGMEARRANAARRRAFAWADERAALLAVGLAAPHASALADRAFPR